ncbi:hypothetical protein Mesil_1758 [Allomeiothermus silvanus DSM 9946]|uniref:Uncharacterized protein n=1 Tax=Allomeiothermus silvanus (strain ATCC 700542 / DSM 9946 / NBRC 106475 / NCIMB 13440 / VI-R2) TaxID=526227 RepID=D7BFT3_ALLS1|nr:hypothetical protein [Allomeiothermus silvanus]ADH63636.1 hypothetical protein Mesil_1758 [Allomeiothermus silvanus DSM 9946]
MAEFRRIQINANTPLTPGFYEFVGEVEGSPERATKSDIQSYLRGATRLPDLEVLDWARVSGNTWRVLVQVKTIPKTQAQNDGMVHTAVAPVVVWVVGIIVTALLVGYGIFKFNQTKLEMFQLIPEPDRKSVAIAQSLNFGLIAVAGLAVLFLVLRK